MTTVAWWHCFSGIAGDMALGSLVDAGADLAVVERELAALPVGGWTIEAVPVMRAGLACTQVVVDVQETSVVRTYAHIEGLLTEARLPERPRRRALAAFRRLADAEGRLHRRPRSQVHFHEVGSTDAIVDIVGTCVALELLDVDRICVSPIAQGTGLIRSAHGLLPNPAPAVVELLGGAPTYGTDIAAELTTPTGAALVAGLASDFGPMPAMTIRSSGFGAGSRDRDGMANAVQVVVGEAAARAGRHDQGQPLALMEANVDDVTGEILGHVIAQLLTAGALDAWVTPVVGKKGRPAHVVSTLVDDAHVPALRTLLLAETGSLGVRITPLRRWASARAMDEVMVDRFPVRVKRSVGRIKAEYDDVVRVAAALSLPAREVARRAEEAAHAASRPSPDHPAGQGSPGPTGPA